MQPAGGHGGDAAASKVRQLGATIVKEAIEIPEIGWFSVLVDPTGATLALWQPHPKAMPG